MWIENVGKCALQEAAMCCAALPVSETRLGVLIREYGCVCVCVCVSTN